MRRRPLVIAHRGASAHAPDNSIEAFALAADQGADGIELDVRFSHDGVAVISHDAEVPVVGVLAHSSFAEIRERAPLIPTLDEVLDVAGEMLLNIEIKNHPRDPDFDPAHKPAEAVVAWIGLRGIAERVLVSSFNPETAARVRALDATVATGLLLEHSRGLSDELRSASATGHRWLLPRRSVLRAGAARVVTKVHKERMLLGTWTVDRPTEIARLGRAGLDAIVTNDPATARAVYA